MQEELRTRSVDHKVCQVMISFYLTLHISDELLGQGAEERLDGELGLLQVELGLLAKEESMQLHAMVELQLLVAFDSEETRIVLSYRDVLAFEGLLSFVEVTTHIRWHLLHQCAEEPCVTHWVVLVRELPDTLLERQAKRPPDTVGRSLDLDDAGTWVRLSQEESLWYISSHQTLVDQVDSSENVRKDANCHAARAELESQEAVRLLADWAQVFVSTFLFY